MFRILGEGEAETLAEPHRLPRDLSPAVLKNAAPLTQRGNTLNPIPSMPRDPPGDSTTSSDIIAAYNPNAHQARQPSPVRRATHEALSDSAQMSAALQKHLGVLEHQVSQGVDEVSQLRQQYMLANRDAAAHKAQLQALTEMVHGLQQNNAALQVCTVRFRWIPPHCPVLRGMSVCQGVNTILCAGVTRTRPSTNASVATDAAEPAEFNVGRSDST